MTTTQVLKLLSAALEVVPAIAKMAKLGGDSTVVLTGVSSALDTLVGGLNGEITEDEMQATIAALTAKVVSGDAAADAALDEAYGE